jgi:Leucine-rich repeat (LRR) protein
MKRYPFKFLDPYNKNDANFFSGRDEEIASLYEMVFQSPILLVYGASGTGKTSLIQCGLASRFASHDWMALTVRRGVNINVSLQKVLTDAGGYTGAETVEPDWLSKFKEKSIVTDDTGPAAVIASALKNIYLNSFKPVYLIFDQFEELYIFGSKNEQADFIRSVQQILLVEQPVKMIFSIREEYLGYLDEFERVVPQLTHKKLRVEAMNDVKIKQVIDRATGNSASLVTIVPGQEKEVAALIFEKLKMTERSKTIQLPYLQVFLDRFYLSITQDGTRKKEAIFNLEELSKQGRIGDILQNFLEEQVNCISAKMLAVNPYFTPETIWNMLSPFATLDGTKEPISKDSLYNRLPDVDTASTDTVVEEFVSGRIIRYDENADRYELAHDSLARRIGEKRSKQETDLLEAKSILKFRSARNSKGETLSESDLIFIEPQLCKIKLTAEEERLISESKDAVDKRRRAKELRLQKDNEQLKKTKRLLQKNAKWQKVIILVTGVFLAVVIAFAYNTMVVYKNLEALQLKTKKLIASVHFYRDKIGLSKVEKDGKVWYGFIDKNLDVVIDYKYTDAETFDDTGFAKVRRGGKAYLIDVVGHEYMVSTSIDSLTDSTTALFLSDMDFKIFPVKIFDHTNLKVLILSDCGLDEIPPEIEKLTNLRQLDLSQNYFTTVPESILKLSTLTTLNMSGNDLASLPKDIDRLHNLRELQLYWNPALKVLPAGLSNLRLLNWLDVSGTGVKETGKGIRKLLSVSPKCRIIWKGNPVY